MSRRFLLLYVCCAIAFAAACGSSPSPPVEKKAPVTAPAPSPPVSAAPATPNSARPRIVFLGDSLTAGLGLPVEESYPALIQRRLEQEGYAYEVVNAGVSGDTSAGGLRRLEWSLDGDVRVLIVALGGNDGLRGLPPDDLKRNLSSILDRAAARHVTVILAGMEAPPNNGREYTDQFRAVYVDLAKTRNLRLIPFLLEGVAGDPTLNQPDGIHPNSRGARIVADVVWRAIQPALERSPGR
jgi:acyl-CoA thioesterase-1